jgi:hypothetical protein
MLFIFYLGHFVILVFFVALVIILFVVPRWTFLYCHLSSLSSHNLIPLVIICGSASHYLFGLTRRLGLYSAMTLKS